MATTTIREQARDLVDKMPENATRDDLIYESCIRQVTEKGLSDSEGGRTKDVRDVRLAYGLTE